MRTARLRTALIPGCAVAALLAVSGCGSTEEQKTAAVDADIKTQVENVCRQVAGELKGLAMPTTDKAAVEAQTQSAQIFQTSTGKLRELETNAQWPAGYKSWIEEYAQLSKYNEQAAQAFSKDEMTSDQALQAGQDWEAQAKKANALATEAGLNDCVVGQSKSS